MCALDIGLVSRLWRWGAAGAAAGCGGQRTSPLSSTASAGVPFRETHHISGAAVKMAEDRGCELSALTVADLQSIHPLFGDDVTQVRRRGGAAEREDGGCVQSVVGMPGSKMPCLLPLRASAAGMQLAAFSPPLYQHHCCLPAPAPAARCGTSTGQQRCATPRAAPASGRCWSRCRSYGPTWQPRSEPLHVGSERHWS